MPDVIDVIKGLKCRLDINGSKYKHCLTCDYRHDIDHCQWAFQTDGILKDALALLKAQEPIEARLHLCESCTKEYPECDAKIDGIEFGSGNGNDNIIGCTAYVNRWKSQKTESVDAPKPDSDIGCWYNITHNYTLEQVVSALKAQEPIEPTLKGKEPYDYYCCGACDSHISIKDKYCAQCGRAVKWK